MKGSRYCLPELLEVVGPKGLCLMERWVLSESLLLSRSREEGTGAGPAHGAPVQAGLHRFKRFANRVHRESHKG